MAPYQGPEGRRDRCLWDVRREAIAGFQGSGAGDGGGTKSCGDDEASAPGRLHRRWESPITCDTGRARRRARIDSGDSGGVYCAGD